MTDKTEAATGLYTLTAPAVMAHPALVEPRKYKRNGKESGEPKYGVSFVFDPNDAGQAADIAGLKAAAGAVAKAKWPGRALSELKFPFLNGDKQIEKRKEKLAKDHKEYRGDADFQAGKVLLKASSVFAPRLSGLENGRAVDYEDPAKIASVKGKFFFGAEALGQVMFKAYDAVKDGDQDGVTAYLQMVLVTGKGKRLAGGQSAADAFKGYVGKATAENPTEGSEALDDEISF